MSSPTTSGQIIHHTTAFLSQTLSQTDFRQQIFTAFFRKLQPNLVKPLNFASQTIENAISTNSTSIRTSSLRLAETFLSTPKNPFSSFLLSLVYHLSDRAIDASIHLLHVFYSDSALARSEIAPILFQELFLTHFIPILDWYNEKRSNVLSSLSLDSGYNSDDQSIVSSTTLLSKISGDLAFELKNLERDYEDLLDVNCRIFVEYFENVLLNDDGDGLIVIPLVVMEKRNGRDGIRDSSHEMKIKNQEFGLMDRRYNPIWTEDDESVTSNKSKKSLSKFPSFFPERVSANVLTNQRSLKKLKSSLKQFNIKIQSSTYDNLSDYSSLDSEATQEEKFKRTALFDFKQNQTHKQKQPFSVEASSTYRPPYPFMEDIDNPPGGGKQTPPKDFVCPITTHIFHDPVTLETGQTYERKAIQEWIDRGNSSCPITRQTLSGTYLPKTNYVLKRLIASWKEKNPGSPHTQPGVEESKFKPASFSGSPNSVITQATIDGIMSELRLAITDICTSEVLREAELAVLKIEQFWREASTDMEMQSMLSKPPVVNGFVEVLFNSVDTQVLKATVFLLTELGSRDENVLRTLTRVDSDVECIIELFKKGLVEAVVLVYLLKPTAVNLVEMEIVDVLLEIISNGEDECLMKMCMKPKIASLFLLGDILRNSGEESLSMVVKSIISKKAIEKIVESLRGQQVKERIAAVSILLTCIMKDGKCRNIVADKADLSAVVESFTGLNDAEQFELVHFLSELIKLNRRNLNEKILHILKDEGTYSIMHTLLIYLQNATQDQAPLIAGLLLQLDLLEEPRKMSIYREEAVDTLISCLRNSEFPDAQISAAETLLSLQGRFSYSGKSLARAIILKRAGLDWSYKAFMRKDQRHQNISPETQDTMEEQRASEEWEGKVAFVLVSHEFGLLFEALAEGLKSRYEELHSICFMASTWLVYMLSILPDTGIRGAARVCLLKHFLKIFRSETDNEDRALSMLALNTFTRDPEGLQDLGPHMKEILKGLREMKKSSPLAFQMLKAFSEEHENSSDIWSHKELSQEDCSMNGEVLAITCFNAKIFSGHSDGTIKVWSCEHSEINLLEEMQEHTKPVTSLAVLSSSEKLYSGSLDRTVRVWSITDEGIYCEQVHEMKDQINNLVISNSMACYIAQGAGVKTHFWNGSSKVLNQNKYVKCLSLAQGKLYCGCADNSIQEVDLVNGTLGNVKTGSKRLIGKNYPIYALQVYDGLIYSAGPSVDGANVKIWSTLNYSMVASLPILLDVRTMAVSSELIYLGCKGGVVEIWCKKKYNKVETLQCSSTAKILCMALDTNEDMLITGTGDGKIQIWGLS